MLHISNKIKVLFILAFVFTGCKATYNINIDKKNINESLDVIEENTAFFDKKNDLLYNSSPKEYLTTTLKWPTPVYKDVEVNPLEPTEIDGISYYNKKDISTSLKLGINYSFRHKQKDYGDSNIVNTCYDFDYKIVDNKILFETTSVFKCFSKYQMLDSVEVNLNTNCKVIDENSDKKIENNYIWNITKTSVNKKIKFNLSCGNKKTKNKHKKLINLDLSSIVIFLILPLIIGFVVSLVVLLNKRNNRL